MEKNFKRIMVSLIAVLPLLAANAGRAAAHPDISGAWVHTATSRLPHAPPQWTPTAIKMMNDWTKYHVHNGVSDDSAYCLPAGMPFMMSSSEGFDITYDARELEITSEERPSPRHIYWDGRGHADMSTFDPTTVGNSTGRWEGDILVVDTIGFLPGPSGGMVLTPATHLVEHYHLEDHGDELRIDFTWTDPTVLLKPYSYTYLMARAPDSQLEQEYYCDPRNAAQQEP